MRRPRVPAKRGAVLSRLAWLGLLVLHGCLAAGPPLPVPAENVVQDVPFDAVAAWDEFETALRSNYAYLDAAGTDAVERQLARSREAALAAADAEASRRLMHRTALTFGDPHLIVGPFDDDDFNIVMTAADLDIVMRDGLYVVADVRAGSAADAAEIRPGWELVRIERLSAAEAARLPFGDIVDDPTQEQLAYGATLAANGRRGAMLRRLTFRLPSGETATRDLPSPRTPARGDQPVLTTSRLGPGGRIGMIRFENALGDNTTIGAFDAAIASLADTESIVLDLRNTPSGGNTEVARSVIGHFVDDWRPYQVHTIPRIEREYGVPRRFVEYAAPREPRYRGTLVVLHGRWTGSMGEGLVIGLDAAANAVTIGSNMGDLLGALWNVDLPLSGARLDVGGEALFHPNGTPREDYVADRPLPSADRDERGRDPALAAALRLLSP